MRKNDIIEIGTRWYLLYWDTASDGKKWCRVKAYDFSTRSKYQYPSYFKTKKAARLYIEAENAARNAEV